MPQFFCVHCGQQIDADAALSGIQTTCPVCEGLVTVPVATSYAGKVPLPSSPPSFIRSSQRFEWVNEPTMTELEPPHYSWIWPTLATLVAGALTFVGFRANMSRGVDSREFYEVPMAQMANQYIASFFAVAGAALLIAAVIALGVYLTKKVFMGSLWLAYNIVVLVLGLSALAAGMMWEGQGIPGIDPTYLGERPAKYAAGSSGDEPRDHSKDPERLRALVVKVSHSIKEVQSDYTQEIVSINAILDPNHLNGEDGLKESVRKLANLRHLTDRTRDRVLNIMEDFSRDVNLLKLDGATRRVASGIERDFGILHRLIADWSSANSLVFERYDALLMHLQNKKGHWTVKDGRIVFENEADLQGFNKMTEDVSNYMTQAEAANADMSAELDRQVKKLQSTAEH